MPGNVKERGSEKDTEGEDAGNLRIMVRQQRRQCSPKGTGDAFLLPEYEYTVCAVKIGDEAVSSIQCPTSSMRGKGCVGKMTDHDFLRNNP